MRPVLVFLVVGGTLATLIFFLDPEAHPAAMHGGILGAAVNVVLLSAVNLATTPQPTAHAAVFVAADPRPRPAGT
jgi:hypothetical protein